ncbi:erythroid differentiation-related factor 1 [Ixodes scapularis]|uniref:erythroid differentiation-related factor 1 n=1 Tax=Ixodes scapularis TaxID=6945 RepID=UPI001A9D6683|nr:erythroid differentiation-related factor 1 [Ixodes scapularis]
MSSEETASRASRKEDDDVKDMTGDDIALQVLSPVKSSAVLKHPLCEPAIRYLELSSNTNLNKPPSNWLRGDISWHGLRAQWTYPQSSSTIFSSFHMANNFTEYIGEVDVISDAENIKKLLKMPYSNSHISMMVHRVGKTLLLDEFDVHRHLLRESQKQWEWLRNFFYDTVLASLQEKEKVALRKNKRRDILQNKNMFSKFLYYSLEQEPSAVQKLDIAPEGSEASHEGNGTDGNSAPRDENRTVMLPEGQDAVENAALDGSSEHLRNLLWTFEDIRMLIGSNMPIFGGGTRPAVSLKLRDMQKPINILTGLDYWLDNLMCNVPEVVMCYHLNGIVQKYELLKTEEIPHLKDSHFSPRVVKDIAQNILSFLKVNAAKSGHTYWLFKGKNDDVVKLYDLTVLCSELVDDKQQNPFTLPVAVLLFRVAANMKESPDCKHKQGTIYRLLKNSLQLLDSSKHPHIVSSVHSLLSDLFVPSDLDPGSVRAESPENSEHSDEGPWQDSEEEEASKNLENPSVSVGALCVAERIRSEGRSDAEKAVLPYRTNWEERCRLALLHVLQGMALILSDERDRPEGGTFAQDKPASEKLEAEPENVNIAEPYVPIPLRYFPLGAEAPPLQDEVAKEEAPPPELLNSRIEVAKSLTNLRDPSWQDHCLQFLLQKAARTYCTMAEIACCANRYGRALRWIRYGLHCHEQLRFLVAKVGKECPLESLVYLLGLAGDVYLMLVHGDSGFSREVHREDFELPSKHDQQLLAFLEKISGSPINLKYCLAGEFPQDLERTLILSARCYASALKILSSERLNEFQQLTRRLGNISNELGVFYMNQAARIFNEQEHSSEQMEQLWAKSQECLEKGVDAFDTLNDVANLALVNSNLGRLMRLRAHAASASQKGIVRGEFTAQERTLYNRAISYYNKASRVLGDRKLYPDIWDSVNWELSSALFTLGTLLQDYAPLSTHAQEEIEKEVVKLMLKSLDLCSSETSLSRQPLYQYRAATIYHRLASLHHNAYRNQMSEESRRKQQKALAEHYYERAQFLFENMENVTEFMRVLLEHAGLLELQIAGLQGFNSKVSRLQSLLRLFLTSHKMIGSLRPEAKKLDAVSIGQASDSENLDELEDRKALLMLLEKRIQATLQSILKLHHSSVKHRNEGATTLWKQLYSASLRRRPDEPVELFLDKLLTEIKDTLDRGT